MQKQVYFVSGIDTGIGKSIATGLYAKELAAAGCRVITQKIVQACKASGSPNTTATAAPAPMCLLIPVRRTWLPSRNSAPLI